MIFSRREFIEHVLKAGGGLMLGANSFLLSGCDKAGRSVKVLGKAKYKRVILLGMDGLDPKVLSELMAKGLMPNFSKLTETGSLSNLATSTPAQSPTAWSNIATGTNPGRHGVFDFISPRRADYIPELAVLKRNPNNLLGKRGSMFLPVMHGDAFWDMTSSEKIPSTIIRWPITFPPRKNNANVYAGLGVPDLSGSLGKYSFYTTRSDISGMKGRDKIIKVELDNGVIQTFIKGPKVSGLIEKKDATAELMIKVLPDHSGVEAEIKGRMILIKEKEWSKWAEVSFDVGLMNKVSGIVKFYLNSTDPYLELYMTSVELNPKDPAFIISNPDDYVKNLAGELGLFHTLGISEDTKALSDGRLDEEAFIKMCDEVVDEQESMLTYELSRFKDGLLSFIFSTTDRIQHMFWATRDPGHPAYDREYAERYGHVIDDLYIRMDRILGDIMDHVDQSTALLVFSDHGFTTFRRSVNLNTWLVENGFMVLDEGSGRDNDREGILFRNVDWKRTKAYSLGFSSIYLNLKGRESEGTVNPGAEAEAVISGIRSRLLELKDPDNGSKVIKEVYLKEMIYSGEEPEASPDLIIGFNEGYRMSWQTAIGGTPDIVLEDNMGKWTGDHIVDPSFVPGILAANFMINSKDPSLLDIAPTVLSCFGFSLNEPDGQSLI